MTDDLLTVSDCRSRLPFKISERTLRRKLREFGRIVEHRNQIALKPELWPAFLDTLTCSNSSSAGARHIGKSSGRALTPEGALEKARALIAKNKRKAS